MSACGPAGHPRRLAALAACLALAALAVAGCASLRAELRTSAALQGAGYQNVDINIATGSGLPAGGQVSVTYGRGPTGNDRLDAQHAEKIVWDSLAGHFGALAVLKESGGCAGPVCASNSTQIAGVTYAQLAARFGPRPRGLDTSAAGAFPVPGWAIALGVGIAVALMAGAAVVLAMILRGSRLRAGSARTGPPGPPGPPPWPAGPPPGAPPWPAGPPPGAPPWPAGPPPGAP